MHILVADDNLGSRSILKFVLSQFGTVDEMFDGQEAREAYIIALENNDPYDLVVVDYVMPGFNAVQITKFIRHIEYIKGITNKTGIIIASGYSEDMEVCKKFNIKWLQKPIKPFELKELVKQELSLTLSIAT
jgi:two-component system, chemotaxis family, chemotaxis protein CheY